MAQTSFLPPKSDHRSKLVTTLLEQGAISSETAQDLSSSLSNWSEDKIFIQYLLTHKVVPEAAINQAYARIFNIPYVSTLGEVDEAVIKLISLEVCRQYMLVAYKLEQNNLFVAIADPMHIKENQPGILAGLKKSTGYQFKLVMTPKGEYARVMAKYPQAKIPPVSKPAEASVKAPVKETYSHLISLGKVDLVGKAISVPILQKVPEKLARKYRFVAFSSADTVYSVAAENPKNEDLLKLWRYLETANHIRLQIYTTDTKSLELALNQYPTEYFVSLGDANLTKRKIDSVVLHKIPVEVAQKYRFVVFGQNNRTYLVAAENLRDPNCERIWRWIELHNQIKLEVYQASVQDLDFALELYLPSSASEQSLVSKPKAEELASQALATKSAISGSPNVALLNDASGETANLTSRFFTSLGIQPKPRIITQELVEQVPKPTTPPPDVLPPASTINQPLVAPANPATKAPEPLKSPTAGATGPTFVQANVKQYSAAIQQAKVSGGAYQPVARSSEQKLEEDNDLGAMLEKDVTSLEELQEIIKSGYVPKIVAAIVSYAITLRASDVHIEAEAGDVRVRYRVDGMLQDVAHLSLEQQAAIVSRIKILSKLKIDETRIPQDGRFDVKFKDREVDLRVSSMPMVHGEKIVMRILDKSHGIMSLEELGVVGRAFDCIIDAIKKPYGIVLSTGPTGSGKSTTLYAILNRISVPTVNIITLEDPVEYEIAGVNQSQIKPKIGFTFAEGLRSVLRQDPNIIMVGEIRDTETASMATHAALTGHLVLSTLHTNDAPGALPRLINMGVEPFLITSSVNVVEAQRLVRKVCQNCKEQTQLPQAVVDEIKAELDKIPPNTPKDLARVTNPMQFFHGKGCERCQNGYKGRIGIYEVMPMSDAIEDLAVRKVAATEIQATAIKEGMITMKQDGLLKALAGLTTVDEVLRETST